MGNTPLSNEESFRRRLCQNWENPFASRFLKKGISKNRRLMAATQKSE